MGRDENDPGARFFGRRLRVFFTGARSLRNLLTPLILKARSRLYSHTRAALAHHFQTDIFVLSCHRRNKIVGRMQNSEKDPGVNRALRDRQGTQCLERTEEVALRGLGNSL
jgi:hypothetical protein